MNTKSSSYSAENKQYRINYENEHSFNGEKCLEENEVTFAKVTDNGYVVEAAFKWTELTPEENALIGLELQINDANAEGVRVGTLSWYDESGQGWSNPSVLGTARLVGEAAALTPSEDIAADSKEGMGVLFVAVAVILLGGLSACLYIQKKRKAEAAKKG